MQQKFVQLPTESPQAGHTLSSAINSYRLGEERAKLCKVHQSPRNVSLKGSGHGTVNQQSFSELLLYDVTLIDQWNSHSLARSYPSLL